MKSRNVDGWIGNLLILMGNYFKKERGKDSGGN